MAKVSQHPAFLNSFIKLLTNVPRRSLRNCMVSIGVLLALVLDEVAGCFFEGDTEKRDSSCREFGRERFER